jgi:hypothetical protein
MFLDTLARAVRASRPLNNHNALDDSEHTAEYKVDTVHPTH